MKAKIKGSENPKEFTTLAQLREYCGAYGIRVQNIACIPLPDIAELIYGYGVDYIQKYYSDFGLENDLMQSRLFWNWFKMNWYSHDARFVAIFKNEKSDLDTYIQYHKDNWLTKVGIDSVVFDMILKDVKLLEKSKKDV